MRSLSLLIVMNLLLGIASPAGFMQAETAQLPLTSDPAVVDRHVALGTSQEQTLLLSNEGSVAVAPRLFEATTTPTPSAGRGERGVVHNGLDAVWIDPQIARDQADDPDGMSEFLVILREQADLSAAYAMDDWKDRGEYVYQTLYTHAADQQVALRRLLHGRGLRYTPFWIVNALAVRGRAADVTALAAVHAVAELRATYVAALETPAPGGVAQAASLCDADSDNVCWHLRQIGASRSWNEFGVRGEGITVAHIDSGVSLNHPALLEQYRGRGTHGLDHRYNWFDPYGGSAVPTDSGNHGTHVMGIMVGRGLSADAPAVGVAPAARWIAARACSARDCAEIQIILAAQWMLAPTDPDGQNPRPDLRPHVINNSWTAGRNNPWFTGYVHSWRAAGIYPVFAAGNSGNTQGCGTVQSPGEYAEVTAVGASERSDTLASFSSIGPTADGRIKPDLVAPGSGILSTVADQRSYATNSGTSMASPHIAGAVALLWSANPDLIGNYESTYAALTESAVPIELSDRFSGADFAACRPDQLPNNLIGYGRLNLYAAVAQARVDLPWLQLHVHSLPAVEPGANVTVSFTLDARRVTAPGVYQARILVHGSDLNQTPLTIPVTMRVPSDPMHAVVSGQLRSTVDGAPLVGSVAVDGGAVAATDAQGRYQLTLVARGQSYQLTATATGYLSNTTSLSLTSGLQVTQDFVLEENLPRIVVESSTLELDLSVAEQRTVALMIANQGRQPLGYTATLLDEHYGVWRSDQPNGPPTLWREPPTDAVSLVLRDDGRSESIPIGFSFPLFDMLYTQLSVTANGLLLFGTPPGEGLAFSRSCLPITATFLPGIAVLSADLDPSQPGARISYAAHPEGFLISWEEVPLVDNPAARISFQALLLHDGRIQLHYRNVAGLTRAMWASVGVQQNIGNAQNVSCRGDRPLDDGLSIELRPQLTTANWAYLAQPAATVAPGSEEPLELRVRWIAPYPHRWPLSATIELRTNDPHQALLPLTVRVRSAEPVSRLWFPILR